MYTPWSHLWWVITFVPRESVRLVLHLGLWSSQIMKFWKPRSDICVKLPLVKRSIYIDGDFMPLPPRLQRYCNPASLVVIISPHKILYSVQIIVLLNSFSILHLSNRHACTISKEHLGGFPSRPVGYQNQVMGYFIWMVTFFIHQQFLHCYFCVTSTGLLKFRLVMT